LLLNVTTLNKLSKKKDPSREDLIALRDHYWHLGMSNVTYLSLAGYDPQGDDAYNNLRSYERLVRQIKKMEINIEKGN
jgi:hypothetical protein